MKIYAHERGRPNMTMITLFLTEFIINRQMLAMVNIHRLIPNLKCAESCISKIEKKTKFNKTRMRIKAASPSADVSRP